MTKKINSFPKTTIQIWNNEVPATIMYGFHATPFGQCLIATTQEMICYVSFQTNTKQALIDLKKLWPTLVLTEDTKQTKAIIEQIFATKPTNKPLSLLLKGTPFQVAVWQALTQIPSGQTVAYETVAQSIGKPSAIRAAASAIGKNNIAYLIPCHRFIAKSGKIGGFKWGIGLKKAILSHEKA
jgi:AraC family transcriptional regulator of adaptative response/methylated-DNA-[protein]-cysteine methyltransferase